jgi:N-acetylglucosamine kinase
MAATDGTGFSVIGIDAGGTKTAGVCVSEGGRLVARVQTGPANYQSVGRSRAAGTLAGAFAPLREAADAAGLTVAGICWGLSGLDREKDEAVLEPVTREIEATLAARDDRRAHVLVNDTFLVLRAGTDDGAGVAVVSGTGANTVGVGNDGRRFRVGGLAWELGDSGSGSDIAIAGLRAARRGTDGRGPPTRILAHYLDALGLRDIEDVIDFGIPADEGREPGPDLGSGLGPLAPLVFDAASQGDPVARRILRAAGRELGLSARLVASRLFDDRDRFPLVLGGSVLRKASCPLFARTIVAGVRKQFPGVVPVTLDCGPVLGAALLALDAVAGRTGSGDRGYRTAGFRATLASQVRMAFP